MASAQEQPTITFKAEFSQTGFAPDVTLARPVGWSLIVEAVGPSGTTTVALSESNPEVTVGLPTGSYEFTVPGQSFDISGWVFEEISPGASVVLDLGDSLEFTLSLAVGLGGDAWGDIDVQLSFDPKPSTDWQVTVNFDGPAPLSGLVVFNAPSSAPTATLFARGLPLGVYTISTANESANLSGYVVSISPVTTTVSSGATSNVDIDYTATGQPIPTVTAWGLIGLTSALVAMLFFSFARSRRFNQ